MTESETEVLLGLPPAVYRIYDILNTEENLTIDEMTLKSNYSRRTVQNALNLMEKRGLLIKTHCLTDMRRKLYSLSGIPLYSFLAEIKKRAQV
ncbi:MAG: hypothetical protein EAX86_06265 [Candidatus Heimdallarchaeota archaeon]|nr:hypothetical protein [Candidatus Heimdallarchaeota archaeon]